MKLGTHDSMTYLPPKRWYLYPFKFMAKCQSKDIETQYKLGARMFDLRVKFNDGNPEFAHGLLTFKGDVFATLSYLNTKGAYIRLLLEATKENEYQENHFIKFCQFCEQSYTNLTFFCGRRKFDWKQLYKFPADDIDIVQKVSSTIGSKIDDLWPWLYARFTNKKNYKNRDKDKWLLVDFIEYCF